MQASSRLSADPDHRALAEVVATVARRAGLREQARAAHDQPEDALPAGWKELAAADLLAIGFDAGPVEVGIVAAELGRELAPGPVVPTLATALLVRDFGSSAQSGAVEAGLRDASFSAAVAGAGLLPAAPLLGGSAVSHLLIEHDGRWSLQPAKRLALDSTAAGAGLDPSRRTTKSPAVIEQIDDDDQLPALTTARVQQVLGALLAAESCGIAAWCTETAVDYAGMREQFGRPIGAFQAVKHRCADMFCATELAMAATWDALSAIAAADPDDPGADLAVAVAAALANEAAVEAAKGLIQVLGGIGFTWEHDAHLYLKRALATRQFLGGVDSWRLRAARLAADGIRRSRQVDLGGDAENFRAEVRDFLATLNDLDPQQRRQQIVDAGYFSPHWPRPFGREAGPVEQLVIAEEFKRAGVDRPDLVIGAWAAPTIIAHGSQEQTERFVRATLLGGIAWCQMFSEPGAGSDLAALTTKATRVDGGWSLSGQKVWTSAAQSADWAICLARTSPVESNRHAGITYFLVDMASPGIDIRPLRELTGEALFNEIFLNDVFVPDSCVVGEVGGGWRLARVTLANERVAMSSGSAFPSGVEELLQALSASPRKANDAVLMRVGELVAVAQGDAMLGVRATLAQVSGTDPGAASSVRKLVGMHLRQDAAELAMELHGEAALTGDASAAPAVHRLLATRALTIAGGTSEVLHNVIGERILGLPR